MLNGEDAHVSVENNGPPHAKIQNGGPSAAMHIYNGTTTPAHTARASKENSKAEVKSRTLGNRTASLYLGRSTTTILSKTNESTDKTDHRVRKADPEKRPPSDVNKDDKPSSASGEKEGAKEEAPEPDPAVLEAEARLRDRYEALYVETCRRAGIIPVSFITKRLCDVSITIRSHGLGPEGARAIAVALVNNERVESLDVTDNWIGTEGAIYLAEMISENTYITELNLSENLIDSKGIQDLCEVVRSNECLKTLNLSGTGIKDTDAKYVADVIENNYRLKEFYVSHNEIGDEGGKVIGKALRRNGTLHTLDLSWNHLRRQGAVLLSKGIQENCNLRRLDLSWNGFGVEGCKALKKALEKNFTLLHFDLRCNRLHTEAVSFLLAGLKKNEGLKTLRLACNPITPETAFAILSTISSIPDSPLQHVDMSDIVVDKQFVNLLRSLEDQRAITITHGPCISKMDASANNKDANSRGAADPRDIMFEFMNKDQLRSVDFFKRIDKSGKGTVSKKKFKEGIIYMEIPLTAAQLENLVDLLDKDKSGQITVKELNDEERAYKRKMHALKRKRAKLEAMKKLQAEKDSDED